MRTRRRFAALVGAIAAATVLGLVALWPSDPGTELSAGLTAPTERAEVTSVIYERCPPPQPGICGQAEIALETGPAAGTAGSLMLGGSPLDPRLEVGDGIFEIVAKEIVATLVGSIGLIAAVPMATALAAKLALSIRDRELEAATADAHHH